MRNALQTVALALACLCCSPADTARDTKGWASYGNNRLNFAVCYPPAFRPQGESTNGDGQRFRTSDGGQLAAFGSNVEAGTRLDAYLSDSIEEVAGKGAKTSYRAQKHNWLVASGAGSKGEFYIKRFMRQDQMVTLELIYPARLHARYAPLTAAMIGCFTIGTEPGY